MIVITPSNTMLSGGDCIAFRVSEDAIPVENATWSIVPPNRGSITAAGVYTAPKLTWISKNAVVVATANGQTATATVLVSASHTWIGTLTAYWLLLGLVLIASIYRMWPGDVIASSEEIVLTPAAVTLKTKDSQLFAAKVPVNWPANAPNGVFQSSAPGQYVVTATSVADPKKTASATVNVINEGSLSIYPPSAELRPGQTLRFTAFSNPPDLAEGGVTWSSDLCKQDGTCTAPKTAESRETFQVVATVAKPAMSAAASVRLLPASPTASAGAQLTTLQFLTMMFLFGALGGLLHGIMSMVAYVGSIKFASNWGPYYIFQPFVGGIVAVIVYLLPATTSSDPAGSLTLKAGISALVGLFSDLALQKLKEVFDVLIGPKSDPRTQKLQTTGPAKPAISSINPATVAHGGAATSVNVIGTGFAANCSGTVNGSQRATVRQGDTSITITLTTADVAAAGTLAITVVNPNGDASNAVNVQVT